MSISTSMSPLLATIIVFDHPLNLIFLDYLMFNFDKYLKDQAGSKTINLILKKTKNKKFIDYCIQFTERIIDYSRSSLNIASMMTILIELDLNIEELSNLIKILLQKAHFIFKKPGHMCKAFVKLALKLSDY